MILLVVEGPFLSACSSGANETPTFGPSPTATMVQLAKLFPDVADYIQRGDYDNAIRALDRKIADKPAQAEAFVYRGFAIVQRSEIQLGAEWDSAIKDFQRALQLKPELVEAKDGLGVAYFHQHEYDLAIAELTSAIELNPSFVSAYYHRGMVYQQPKTFDKSISDYKRAIELEPSIPTVYLSLGRTYFEKGDLEAALQVYSDLLKLQPDYAPAYYQRASIYQVRISDPESQKQAIQDLEKTIELTDDPQLRTAAERELIRLRGK